MSKLFPYTKHPQIFIWGCSVLLLIRCFAYCGSLFSLAAEQDDPDFESKNEQIGEVRKTLNEPIMALHKKRRLGVSVYEGILIYLKNKNADEVFRKLKQKQDNGEAFTEDDYAALSLTPLMSGKMSRKDMFKEAIRLAKPNIELSAEKTTAMLYTLADKFLDRAELDEIKEVIRMTRLGQMLMDEGMEKGIELNQTDSIKKLMKNMNLTIDQAMNALEVPEDKREKYRKTITPDN